MAWKSVIAANPLRIACILVFSAAGCGSTVEHQSAVGGTGGPGGSGGSGSSTGSNGSGGGAGGSTTTSSTTNSTSATTGTGGACAQFADEERVGAVTLRLRNDSGLPIYVPGRCGAVAYDLVSTSPGDDDRYAFEGTCLQTCEMLQTQPPIFCPACPPLSFLLPPGGTRDVAWRGTGLHEQRMPASCWESPETAAPVCNQILAAKPGQYRVLANGFAECDDGTGPGSCSCTPDGECNGMGIGLEAYADSTKFDFPTSSVVEVVFGGCAFPCPNP